MDVTSKNIKVLEIKEAYTVQTEMLKNRTHQSYKWVEVAVSKNQESLREWAEGNLHPTQEYRIKNRY